MTDQERAQAIIDQPAAVVRSWSARFKEGVMERWYASGNAGPALLTGTLALAIPAAMLGVGSHVMDQKMAPYLAALNHPAPLAAGLDVSDASSRLQLARHLSRALARQGGSMEKLAKVCDAVSLRLPSDRPEDFLDMLDWAAQRCGRNLDHARASVVKEIQERQPTAAEVSEGAGFNPMGPGISPVSAGSNGMAL